MAQAYWDDVHPGQEISILEPMNSMRLVIWAAASGDFYQIHYDAGFAKDNHLPDVLVHGVFKGMLVGKLLHGWVGEQGRIITWGDSYRGMNGVNDELTVWGKVTKTYEQDGEHRVDLDVGVRSKDGREGSPGRATVALPKR